MKDDKPVAKGDPKNPGKETLTEKVGTHSMGAAAGAVGGAVAGAIAGIAAGPLGSLAGAAGGALLGGAAGASTGSPMPAKVAEHDAYWREHYADQPYVDEGASYDDYAPAYRYGTESYLRSTHPQEWQDVESDLGAGWDTAKGPSRLTWDRARHAVRDAWNRMRGVA